MNTAGDNPHTSPPAVEPGGSQRSPLTAFHPKGQRHLPVRLIDDFNYAHSRTEINNFIDTRTK